MKVEDVPADVLTEMTSELYQEFCIGGCVPQCHLTKEWIRIGHKFKLATVPVAVGSRTATIGYRTLETREVMLSEKADVKKFIKLQLKEVSDYEESRRQSIASGHGGCFRVNGKIVH